MGEKALSLLEAENEIIKKAGTPLLDLAPRSNPSDEEIFKESGLRLEDIEQRQGLLKAILGFVVGKEFDKAITELQLYGESKFNYPNFQPRAEMYIQRSKELIQLIQEKREYSSKARLKSSKQQELQEKVYSHYRDLKLTLRRIEAIDRELRLEDLKSTVIFLKTFFLTLSTLILVLFLREVILGRHLLSWWWSLRDLVLQVSGFFFELVGL